MGYFFTLVQFFWGAPLEEMGYPTKKKVRRNDEPFLLFLLDLNQGPSD